MFFFAVPLFTCSEECLKANIHLAIFSLQQAADMLQVNCCCGYVRKLLHVLLLSVCWPLHTIMSKPTSISCTCIYALTNIVTLAIIIQFEVPHSTTKPVRGRRRGGGGEEDGRRGERGWERSLMTPVPALVTLSSHGSKIP